MSIVFVGIDLAKNVFAVHGVNESGKPALVKPSVARAKLLELVASLPPCTIGLEACSGAHHWARQFTAHGHRVRLMAPKFVTPYRLSGKQGKNDAADAAAICEAVQRPNMRFVPIKNLAQQGQLGIHRVRQGFIEQRTATINRIRGLLAEFGIVLPLKASGARPPVAWRICRAGPTRPWATCSASCTTSTSASGSTTSTSRRWPERTAGRSSSCA